MASANTKTISVTMWVGQAELLSKAATKREVSVSEYIRAHTLPPAAKEVGIAMPEFPPFEPPHYRRGNISIVAESLGMTPEKFKQFAAEQAAEAVISKAEEHARAAAPAATPAAPVVVRRRRRAES